MTTQQVPSHPLLDRVHEARTGLHTLAETQPVYLDLWVKVLPNWRRNRNAVMRLGYGDPNSRA